MYSFAQRADTQVVDEPLYGHYLRETGAEHPGADEIMAEMDCDADRVIRKIILGPSERPVLFFKNMAHHLDGVDRSFLDETINVILTRNPRDMLPSLAAVLEEPKFRDTGYAVLAEILGHTLTSGMEPVVIESSELLKNPSLVLRRLCEHIGIEFDEAMLSWPAGPRPEDGIWAKYWYKNVHKSTGFMPYKPKTGLFPDELRSLLAESEPYYRQLVPFSIRVDA